MVSYEKLPVNLQGGMKRYIEDGILPGHFLTAVLENNLMNAVIRADSNNLTEIPNIVKWLHWEMPPASHGSRKNVLYWTTEGFEKFNANEYVQDINV